MVNINSPRSNTGPRMALPKRTWESHFLSVFHHLENRRKQDNTRKRQKSLLRWCSPHYQGWAVTPNRSLLSQEKQEPPQASMSHCSFKQIKWLHHLYFCNNQKSGECQVQRYMSIIPCLCSHRVRSWLQNTKKKLFIYLFIYLFIEIVYLQSTLTS